MNTLADRLARLETVNACPGFLAFARILGLRIQNGRGLDAFRMLCEIGAPPEISHKIVEGWPTPATAELGQIMPAEREAAVRLSFFIPEFATAPWPELLSRSIRVAEAQREEEERRSSSGG